MNKAEKIIALFEPYIKRHWKCFISVETMKNIVSLLKEMQPRVLTYDEAVDVDCVWYENIDGVLCPARIKPDASGNYKVYRLYECDCYECEDVYGEGWRCWSSKPTEEQRKAVEWDELE